MKLKAHAKLNLFLEVVGKLPNGYHELESEVVFLELADEIEIKPYPELKISGWDVSNNIALKAAKLFNGPYGAEIIIKKNIPVGGGLGGGSADAAATLYGLNKFWNLKLANEQLLELALKLGADVPACLYAHLTKTNHLYFEGLGEKITIKEQLNKLHFLLVNPNQPLATADVFKNFSGKLSAKNSTASFYSRKNDLEPTAIKLMPEIAQILSALNSHNPKLARMTGSGSTCFAIFKSENEAISAEQKIKAFNPNWLVAHTTLKS